MVGTGGTGSSDGTRTALSVNYYSNTHVDGNINLNKSITTTASVVKLPVSRSTFSIVKGADLSSCVFTKTQGTDISNTWIPLKGFNGRYGSGAKDGISIPAAVTDSAFVIPNYDVSMVPSSRYSKFKLDYKINYKCSHEADQTISFKVTRTTYIQGQDSGGTRNTSDVLVFQDLDLGTAMGVSASGVYCGSYIDDPEDGTWGQWLNDDSQDDDDIYINQTGQTRRKVVYTLHFKIKDDFDNIIDVESGIRGHDGQTDTACFNMITVQEIYQPHFELAQRRSSWNIY